METIIALLSFISLLLIILLFQASGIKAALKRIERQGDRSGRSAQSSPELTPQLKDSNSHESAFEQFLAGDPARLAMSKSEQFAAYRQWRNDKGMNWSSERSA